MFLGHLNLNIAFLSGTDASNMTINKLSNFSKGVVFALMGVFTNDVSCHSIQLNLIELNLIISALLNKTLMINLHLLIYLGYIWRSPSIHFFLLIFVKTLSGLFMVIHGCRCFLTTQRQLMAIRKGKNASRNGRSKTFTTAQSLHKRLNGLTSMQKPCWKKF